MTVISYKHKFIFIHPRRTGGTSLKLALLKFCGEKDIVSDITENQKNGLHSNQQQIMVWRSRQKS